MDGVFELLKIFPAPPELVVERTKPFAEASGSYDEALKMLARYKPPAE